MMQLLTRRDVPAARDAAVPRDTFRGLTVLLVDDDADCREILGYWFESLGATVLAAGSAREALAAARRVIPDVMVTDLAMPDEDGCWLVEEMRVALAPRGRRVPAIACTGVDAWDAARTGRFDQFDGYVTKPVDLGHLHALVTEVLKA